MAEQPNITEHQSDIEADLIDETDLELLRMVLRVLRRKKFRLFLQGILEVRNASGYGSVSVILSNGTAITVQVLKSLQ